MFTRDRAEHIIDQMNSGMVEVRLKDDPTNTPLTPDRFNRLRRVEHLAPQLEFNLTSRGKVYLRSKGYEV